MYIPIFFILMSVSIPLFSSGHNPLASMELVVQRPATPHPFFQPGRVFKLPRSETPQTPQIPKLLPVPRNPDGSLKKIGRLKGGGISCSVGSEPTPLYDLSLIDKRSLKARLLEFLRLFQNVEDGVKSGSTMPIMFIGLPGGQMLHDDVYSRMIFALNDVAAHSDAKHISTEICHARNILLTTRDFFNVPAEPKQPDNKLFYNAYLHRIVIPSVVDYLCTDDLFKKMINGKEENKRLLYGCQCEYLIKNLLHNGVNVKKKGISSLLDDLYRGVLPYDKALWNLYHYHNVSPDSLKLDNRDFFYTALSRIRYRPLVNDLIASHDDFRGVRFIFKKDRGMNGFEEDDDLQITLEDADWCKAHNRRVRAEGIARFNLVKANLSAILAEIRSRA